MISGEESAQPAHRRKWCPNCHDIIEEDLDWICWECGYQIGFNCWFCDTFTKGIVEKCSYCGCPSGD